MNRKCEIVKNEVIRGPYRRIVFSAPEISAISKPGQFVHVQIPALKDRILRRPFSICNASCGLLTLVYKVVGEGTDALSRMRKGESCELLGPQGNGYMIPKKKDFYPIYVCGGYGAASTYLLARKLKRGTLLVGARNESDLLLLDEYRAAGCDVKAATDDGTAGHKGFVTDLLPEVLHNTSGLKPQIFACGPAPMLMALGKLANTLGVPCQLSLDERMCCGIGACFACVVKVKDETNPEGWRYSRSCKEGPVYDATEVYYG